MNYHNMPRPPREGIREILRFIADENGQEMSEADEYIDPDSGARLRVESIYEHWDEIRPDYNDGYLLVGEMTVVYGALVNHPELWTARTMAQIVEGHIRTGPCEWPRNVLRAASGLTGVAIDYEGIDVEAHGFQRALDGNLVLFADGSVLEDRGSSCYAHTMVEDLPRPLYFTTKGHPDYDRT